MRLVGPANILFRGGYWWMLQNHKKFSKHHNTKVSKNKYKAEQVVGHENSYTILTGC